MVILRYLALSFSSMVEGTMIVVENGILLILEIVRSG